MRHRSLPATARSRRRPPELASAGRRPRARGAQHVGGARRRDLDRLAPLEQLERGGAPAGERPAGRRCVEAQLDSAHASLGVDPHVDRLAVERGGYVGDGRAADLVVRAAPSAVAAADDADLCGGVGEHVERTQGVEQQRRGVAVDALVDEGRPVDAHPVGRREAVGPRHRPNLRIDDVAVDDHAVRRGEVADGLVGGGTGLWLQGLRQLRHVGLGLGLPPPEVEGSAGLERPPQRLAVNGPAGHDGRGAIGRRLGRCLARRCRAGGRLAGIGAGCHRHDHARRGGGPERDRGDGGGGRDGKRGWTAHLGSSHTERVTRRGCTTAPNRHRERPPHRAAIGRQDSRTHRGVRPVDWRAVRPSGRSTMRLVGAGWPTSESTPDRSSTGPTQISGGAVERKQAVSLGVLLAVNAAMLGVLVAQVPSFDMDELVPEPSAGTAVWLGVAAALTLAGIVLSAVRWQKVLDALEIRTKLPRLVRHNLAGQFVSNVLPTTIGGDVLRVSRLSRDTGESSSTFASVVLERLTGWLVLPLITIVGFAVNPGLRHLGSATSVALALSLGTLGLLLGVLAAAASSRIGGRFATRADWRRFAGAVHLGINRLRSHPCAAANVLMAGFAYQLALVLAAVAAAQALGLRPASLTALLAFFPAVLIAQVLPISMSGLGVREGAFVLFLGPLGVAKEEAIALGLLLYLLNLAVSLLGAPAFAAGGRPRRTVAAT